ncbi:hypothetical protein J1N10_08415 [Carboxylicivirga sp. A043]|uniref:hypothetical protein n=1 Tax=Carboxylicivirga litoralis TaxID=2816963 RepID=UPI0021CAE5D5|nr:hypothetical protein [Carboxylicivirga sp. A043]MCU4155998.1 hypothetical protein [Carboxylicivirga sp. A043]
MSILENILEEAEEWAVNKHKKPADYDESKLPKLTQIANTITCGSVLLCSGTAAESRLIEEIDGTDFSHAAMIVKFKNSKELYLWTADTVDELVDEIRKEKDIKHAGTHLLKLEEYVASLDKIYPSPDGSSYRFAVARLQGVDVDEKKLWNILYKYDGTPFPSTEDELLHWLAGQLDIDAGMDTSFCAQMVAKTYQEMGWLSSDKPANHYNPGSFAKTDDINEKLINGAKLASPEYFKL